MERSDFAALLTVLRCPRTGQPLREPAPGERERFSNPDSDAILVTRDGKWAYPVEDGFPILLKDKALPLLP